MVCLSNVWLVKRFGVQDFGSRFSVQHAPLQRGDIDLWNVYLVLKILHKVLSVEEPKDFSV